MVNQGVAQHPARLSSDLLHHSRPGRAPAAHRLQDPGPSAPDQHRTLRRGLPRRPDPHLPHLRRQPAHRPSPAGVPRTHRRRMGRVRRTLHPAPGRTGQLRPPLRLPLRTRTRLPALPRTPSRPRPTRPAGRDHHQPRRTHRRSRGAWLARGGRPADRHREGCPRQTRTPHPHRAVHGPRADSAAPPDHAGTAGRERGVTLGTRRCSVGKESFGVEGARAPGAGGGDGLTVGVVDQVPAGKDPVHGGAGRAALAGPHPK